MKCNMSFSLGIVSIILIISIVILVLYRNMKDTTDTTYTTIEKFSTPTTTIQLTDSDINNNTNKLNNLINQLLSTPTIGIISDPINIDNEFQQSVSDSIASQASILASTYSSNNTLTSKQITNIENNITDLENIINNKKIIKINKNKYSRVKSLNNGMEMNLIGTPNTIFQDKTTGKITDAYLVNVNNGCMSVGASDYDIYSCNDKNPKQLFKMQHIINETDYANNIDKSLPFDNVDKNNINYPFAMLKSSNNDECLTNNHGTLTVQPCYSFEAQRWMPL